LSSSLSSFFFFFFLLGGGSFFLFFLLFFSSSLGLRFLIVLSLLLDELLLLKLKGLLGLHLLLDLEHLKFSFSLSLRDLMLSLQSSNIGSSGGLLGSSCLGLLDGLSSEELLLKALGLKSLSSLFFLKLIELGGPLLGEHFLLLSRFLSLSDLLLDLLGLLDLGLSLLLLNLKLIEELLLLGFLLALEFSHSLGGDICLDKSVLLLQLNSLLMGFLGCLLQGLLHSGKLLNLARSFGFLDGLDLNNEGFVRLLLGLDVLVLRRSLVL